MNRNMLDRIIATAKGMAWGVVILILMQMCAGCKSSEKAEKATVKTVDAVQVIEQGDSTTVALYAVMESLRVEAGSISIVEETIEWSEPDSAGNQHMKRKMKRKTEGVIAKTEGTAASKTIEGSKTAKKTDSLDLAMRSRETTKEEKEKTSVGVKAMDRLIFIAEIALIIVIWIWLSKKGIF